MTVGPYQPHLSLYSHQYIERCRSATIAYTLLESQTSLQVSIAATISPECQDRVLLKDRPRRAELFDVLFTEASLTQDGVRLAAFLGRRARHDGLGARHGDG